jgi:hypothetical protein
MFRSALDKLPAETREELESLASAITELFQRATWLFKLNAPEKLTIVSKGGAFSKRPYIGEETFSGQRAYVGKTGKVILVFADVVDRSVSMEMPLAETMSKLDGFAKFSIELQALRENKTMAESRKVAENLEHLAHVEAERARHSINPAFGSW